MVIDLEGLRELSFWETWQQKVKDALPNFCADKIYVDQESIPEEEFRRVARGIKSLPYWNDLAARTRDREYGARLVYTEDFGQVTRMWLDSCVEIDFIRRNISSALRFRDVLDIGAGYGRLAVALAPMMTTVTCVDPVPISTQICRHYCHRFAPSVSVLDLDQFAETAEDLKFDLAVNVHSWSECSLEQIRRWLDVLKDLKVPYLFTVVHGTEKNHDAYFTWNTPADSFTPHQNFRPLLDAYYTLVAEEHIGLSYHPHALWRLRK